MVKPASIPRIFGSLACLALLLSGAKTFAQEAKKLANSKDTLSEEAVFIPIEYRPPPYQVSVGVRISGKAKVKFAGLGAIPPDTFPGADKDAVTARTYNDGSVYTDTYYDVTGARVARPDSLSDDGKTNYWSFSSNDQLVDHPTIGKALALHAYAIESAGATATVENSSSVSWDMEISRQIGGGRKITWGVLFGAGLTSVNAKTTDQIKANLRTLTDYYSVAGIAVPGGWNGLQQQYVTKEVKDANGTVTGYEYVLDADGKKTTFWPVSTQRLADHPGDRTNELDTANPVTVDGYWKVKGAYITTRFGPYIALQLGRHFALKASAGVTFAVLGANFTMKEKYQIPASVSYLEIESTTRDATVSGTIGYFVEGELQAFLTQRTGLFIGATHEDYARDIRMQIYNQTADLSVSSGTAFRTGITTRF